MQYPKFLEQGNTIAFAAPSFGAATDPYYSLMKNTIARFESKGFHTDLGPNAYVNEGIGISNTPEKCARELEEYYMNHGDVLISIGGGELMCETLEKMDLAKIATARPKWFLGYSDNTHFGFLLPTMFDTASLYGPNAPSFGTEKIHKSFEDCGKLLMGKNTISHGYDFWEIQSLPREENPLASYNLTEKTEMKFFQWNGESIRGRFLGGCLDVLNNLCGTKYDHVKEFNHRYGEDGIVWFLEACDLRFMDIRRSLWHLNNAGWFKNVKAFIFGRPYHISDEPDFCGLDEYAAVLGPLSELGVPILMDADIGHLPPIMTMVNGGYGTLTEYKESNIQIQWDFSR